MGRPDDHCTPLPALRPSPRPKFPVAPLRSLSTKRAPTTLTYYATDKAGNVEDQKSLTVKIDKTAPTVQSISPSAGATRVPRDTNVTAKFSEDVIGVLAFNTFMLSNGTSFSIIEANPSNRKLCAFNQDGHA